jgi:proteasome beta subunit
MNEVETALRKGTTTVGLICAESAVLAADTRATAGTLVASKRAQKIFEIEPHIGLTTAGAVGDTQALVSILRAEARLYRMRTRGPITVKGLATLTANVVHGQRYFPYLVQLMMAGTDKGGPSLYMIDLWGGLSEERMASTGSGSPVAYGLLENRYDPEMSQDDGIDLAVATLKAALERDSATGNTIEAAVIDKEGFSKLDDERVKEALDKVPEQKY